MKKHINSIIFVLIILLAAAFRFTGISWDDNAHLHPDERFLTMVATSVAWPKTVTEYFDTARSPANPNNRGYSFFVYGTYPMFLTKLAASFTGKDTYDGITQVGRVLSGIADMLTLMTVFLIGSYITKRRLGGLVAAFTYAVSVLPIQLSHFFTVDPYMCLFMTVVLWRIIRGKYGLLTGIMAGLAIGAKVSAVLILPTIAVSYLLTFPWKGKQHAKQQRMMEAVWFGIGCFLTIRVVYPYLFVGLMGLNPRVLGNWRELTSYDSPTTSFPPGLQWITVSAGQPIWDLFVWGFGIPLSVLLLIACSVSIWSAVRHKTWRVPIITLFVWIVTISVYQSLQFAKPMRYFWPVYPALSAIAGWFIATHTKRAVKIAMIISIPVVLLWPVAYMQVYLHPTTRVTASDWIYDHIPPQSVISWESWDDPLPFARGNRSPSVYATFALPVFDPDSPAKWGKIAADLNASQYLILSSNRGYGAIGRVRKRYPQTYRYYQNLISGTLGFTPVIEITSRPFLPLPGTSVCVSVPGFSYGYLSRPLTSCPNTGITVIDDWADETFTVYDHPKVIIFRKTSDRILHPSDLIQ